MEAPEDAVRRRYADHMNANELRQELLARGLPASNFKADNVEVLNKVFAEEFEKRKKEWAEQQTRIQEKRKQDEEHMRRRRVIDRQRNAEAAAIREDPHVQFHLDLVKANTTPSEVTLRVAPVATRAYVKALDDNRSIQTLDLCRSELADDVGIELGKAMARNGSIKKLDLDFNHFGALTAEALGKALTENSTLEVLSLESNPITDKDKSNLDGIRRIAEALAVNETLLSLNLWGCGIGAEGGAILRRGVEKNSTLLQLQLSPTDGIDVEDLRIITECLKENHKAAEARKEQERQQRIAEQKEEEKRKQEEEEAKQKQLEEEWIEAQRTKRALARRAAEEEAKKKEEEERVEREEKEKQRIAEMKRKEEEAAKKKSKKKKK